MPRGGHRPGAGRPKGARNALPQGSVKAIKAIGLRVPEDATAEARATANRAFERIVDVMEEGVSPLMANSVLTAARHLREEICGAVPKRQEISGPKGEPLSITIDLSGKP